MRAPRSLRPEYLALFVVLVAALAAGCKRKPAPVAEPSDSGQALSASAKPGSARKLMQRRGPRTRAERRSTCEFGPGSHTAATLDPGAPSGTQIPIDHFVVVMQENRSFDHYFERLPAFGQPAVDVAPLEFENPDPSTGQKVRIFPQKELCTEDVRHDWNSAHRQFADGRMDGFLATSNPYGSRALGYYDESVFGYYYALASTFAIADRYFAAILGPTYPNRMFFHSASSFGHISNAVPPQRTEERSLFHELTKQGISWMIYAEAKTFEEKIFPGLFADQNAHFKDLDAFYADLKKNALPAYSWVESTYGGPAATDEHPPADVELGQAFVSRIVKSVMDSSAWPRSAVFLTYDEPGGFFDHVPPPKACPPDDIPPRLNPIHDPGRFDQLGMRVPLIVVSPFARAHFVSHTVYSHTSVMRMVQARFDLPALSFRDANSVPPFDMFDFEHQSFQKPPKLPVARVDETQRIGCLYKFRRRPRQGAPLGAPDYGAADLPEEPGEPEEPSGPTGSNASEGSP